MQPGPVAVTGATGFIGTALLAALLDRGFSVQALTRRPRPPQPGVRWIHGDLEDPRALAELVVDCDAIIHCAGQVRGSDAAGFEATNAGGTANLLSAIARTPAPPRLLLMSSLAAREPQLSWYAASKRHAEQLLEGRRDIPWTIFRPTAVYGPGDQEMRPLLTAMQRGFLPMAGSPRQRIGLLHVDDLGAAILCWLATPAGHSGTYELDDGTPGGYNWDRLKTAAESASGNQVRIIPIPAPLLYCAAYLNLLFSRISGHSPMLTPGKVRELTHPDWVCDNAPAHAAFNWQPRIRLADALREHERLLDGKH